MKSEMDKRRTRKPRAERTAQTSEINLHGGKGADEIEKNRKEKRL